MKAFATSTTQKGHPGSLHQRQGKDSFFGVQAKLTVGKPNDRYEKEADAVADKVVAKQDQNKGFFGNNSFFPSAKIPSVQKVPFEDIQQKQETEEIQEQPLTDTQKDLVVQRVPFEDIQKKETNSTPSQSNALEHELQSTKGGGSPMDSTTKNTMESGFGRDFSNVRLHTDSKAASLSDSLGAQAFTHGNDIYFNQGKHDPSSKAGQHLLAHELTHTVQQGASVQPKQIQRSVSETPTATPTPTMETTSLQSATFSPSEGTATAIEAGRSRGTEIPVSFGELATGTIEVKKNRDDTYSTRNNRQFIPVSLGYLSPLQNLNITPVLVTQIDANTISGYLTVQVGDRLVANPKGLVESLKEHSNEMGWLGIDVSRIPDVENTIDGGALRLAANSIPVEIGGFINGTLDFGIVGTNVTFRAGGTITVPNLDPAQITIERNEEGVLRGEADLAVNIANFNGSIHAAFINGTLDIRGVVGYRTDKMSGEITLLVTDAATARNVAISQLEPSLIDESAREASGIPEANTAPTPGPRAMAGWGEVDFSFTEWMTGRAKVIIDNEGHVTIQGEVTPPAEVELFPQRDYIHNLFTLEARTLYGVPLVGNVFLFANIGMDALAKLGPAKIYNIRAIGTYSTDPAIFNEFSLEATFNLSMFAGLRLRAEGGLGVELLGHDVKVGVGVNALAGIRGYVEATPRIGYRETASPESGRQGEFYIQGHAEMAAQPFLGLGGDLFVELDSPWWSPAPDDKWTWPLGELEYPLPGEFGVGADFDYVLGSSELPEISFGEVDFNKDKFMSDLMNDHVPPPQSSGAEQQGTFEENSTGESSETPQLTDTEGNPNAGQPAQGQQENLPATPPTPEVLARWGRGMEALEQVAVRSQNAPLSQTQVTSELTLLERRHQFTSLTASPRGEEWNVDATMPNISNRDNPIRFRAIPPTSEEAASEENNSELPDIIGMQQPVPVDGGHILKLEGTLQRVEINVYSDKQSLNSLLNNKRQEIHDNGNADPEYDAKQIAITSLFSEKRTLGSNIGAYKRAVDNAYSVGGGNTPVREAYILVQGSLEIISQDLLIVGITEDHFEMPVSRVRFALDGMGRATTLRGEPITHIAGNTRGSTPTQDPIGWSSIPVTLRSSGAWVRAHMLNHRLHGPGTSNNLFPGTRDMNLRDMENQVEHFAKVAVWDEKKIIYYDVDVHYGNSAPNEHIPTQVDMEFGEFDPTTNARGAAEKTKSFTQNPPSTVTIVTINTATSGALNNKALAEGGTNGTGLSGFFAKLVQGRPSNGYTDDLHVHEIVSEIYRDEGAFEAAYTKFRALTSAEILSYD
ncbi:eCIS core domain-containing protein [Cochleicola gelatinilyticus]|uniref:Uncharacterized protein n=1 Tax=Cochleicola gelatinilyticus TaxID=1763537 RepID=A0A167HNS6_9FLAO|nr:DUF4157 domain-containing protein [Cochleicola gelatinilyticus]OAB78805.1 hypothetical protein ULVI_09500 [Cochleicola gelatinilyticus]